MKLLWLLLILASLNAFGQSEIQRFASRLESIDTTSMPQKSNIKVKKGGNLIQYVLLVSIECNLIGLIYVIDNEIRKNKRKKNHELIDNLITNDQTN